MYQRRLRQELIPSTPSDLEARNVELRATVSEARCQMALVLLPEDESY
jgi:hypothetical protein